jgi:KipI family sensor histidine kinase inhibitor
MTDSRHSLQRRPRAAVVAAGDSALLLRIGDAIDHELNERALHIARDLAAAALPGVRDIVVGYASVTVYFDPLAVETAVIEQALRRRARADAPRRGTPPRRITIAATYGGAAGPDLPEVAAFAGCSEDEVIARHVAREYRVFMVGFLPGFPYMGVVDERIAMPRRDTPRLAVPAGSVGIAGSQTGIYPVQSPGGWRLIGQTAEAMFDVGRASPSLLRAGDLVRFVRE